LSSNRSGQYDLPGCDKERWMLRRVGRVLVVAGLALAASVGLATPAHASTDISVMTFYQCLPIYAGQRSGFFSVQSANGDTGSVTAVSLSPSDVTMVDGPSVGQTFGNGGIAVVDFKAGPGPTSVTLHLGVHFDNLGGSGPTDQTYTPTIALNDCEKHPSVKFVSNCDGSVQVHEQNGPANDPATGSTTGAGGAVTFEIFGAYGYHLGPYQEPAGLGPGNETVLATAASDVKVTADGVLLAEYHYTPRPGCAGYVAPPAGSPGGSNSGSGSAAGAPTSPTASPSAALVAPTSTQLTSSAPATLRPLAEPVTTPASSPLGPILLTAGGGAVLGIGLVALVLWRRRVKPVDPA
jgi:hypothetical protein